MREVKFRVIDYVTGKLVGYERLTQGPNGTCWWSYSADGVEWVEGVIEDTYYEGLTRVQYTGLKDKNGVEIYEGDIIDTTIKRGGRYCAVEWDGNVCTYTLEPVDKSDYVSRGFLESTMQSYIEVIGNIYETPELQGKAA